MTWTDVANNFNAIVAGLTGVGTAVGGLLFFLWRASKWFHQTAAANETMTLKLGEVVAAVEAMGEIVGELKIRFELSEREKARIEGRIDANQSAMIQLIGGLQGATSSLDGMWRTLQTLFPEQVPKRASDR